MFSQKVTRHKEGALGKIVLRERALEIGGQRLEDIHAHAGRGSQAGAGRNLRCKKQVDRNVATHLLEDGDRNFERTPLNIHIRDVVPGFTHPQVRGDNLYPAVGPSTQNGIEILVDGRAQYRAAELFIIGGQVSSPAAKTNPNGAANDERRTEPP